MAVNPLVITLDKNANTLFALPRPGYVNSVSLSASTAESITVPNGARFAVFSATGDFYVNYSTTATVPGDVSDGTASELNPSVRDVYGLSSFSVISAGTPIITVAFYS